MATTIPTTFDYATASIDHARFEVLVEAYESALRDEDKAGDPADAVYFEGLRRAYAFTLGLLTQTVDPAAVPD